MELYIGGLNQGKLDYVMKKYSITKDSDQLCDGAVCTKEELFKKRFINHYHEFVKRLLTEGIEPEEFTEELIKCNPSAVIICNEVGAGVVPLDRKDRRFREAVGHCTLKIASNAVHVERISCGLGLVLKESEIIVN
jgi:adenosylcobinamide kinase / adenosylcobinamide-phosphate guanylyltransferase